MVSTNNTSMKLNGLGYKVGHIIIKCDWNSCYKNDSGLDK